jgi:putative ABC transport system substrate-binding protein
MRRRNFLFGLLAAAAMGGARAEQKVQRIAIITSFPVSQMNEASGNPVFQSLFNELRRLGYVEEQNLLIERYSGEGRAVSDLVRDVVRRNPELIIDLGSIDFVLELKAATATIPIVGVFGAPVEMGIIASLARPGGNITGAALDVGIEQWYKRVQLVQQLVPQAIRFGSLETRAVREQWGALERELDRRMAVTHVGPALDHPIDEAEYRRAFAGLAQDRADAVLVNDEPENITNLKLVVELAEKYRLPAIYTLKPFVEAGGLMSYGIDVSVVAHSVAVIANKILKGAKPADIPVEQPTKFELAINLKTAKALGLTVPPELLATADEVIE